LENEPDFFIIRKLTGFYQNLILLDPKKNIWKLILLSAELRKTHPAVLLFLASSKRRNIRN
jgi:hypothetical protein